MLTTRRPAPLQLLAPLAGRKTVSTLRREYHHPPFCAQQLIPFTRSRGARTSNEKAREQMLVEDEMVTIISPQLVQCNRCGTEIKLSKKSLFDTFHWYQHRERCLKRHGDEYNESKVKVRRLMHSHLSF